MRRLPVFFVIDASESMVGEPIKNVTKGINMIVNELKKDPYALENVYLSVIVFAGIAKTVIPLTDLINFTLPQLTIGAGTSYSNALEHLEKEMHSTIVKTTQQQKGDWKPIIYFMTDGNPTDNGDSILSYWEKNYKHKTNIVVVSIGDNCNYSILNKISNDILTFSDSNHDSYKEFFKWVTGSIQHQSYELENTGEISILNFDLIDSVNITKIHPRHIQQQTAIDERYAIFHGKCSTNGQDYLLKYMRIIQNAEMQYNTTNYQFVGAYPLDSSYKKLSGPKYEINRKVSTEDLSGYSGCPCCTNKIAICICKCGNIFCIHGDGIYTCPWCKLQVSCAKTKAPLQLKRKEG